MLDKNQKQIWPIKDIMTNLWFFLKKITPKGQTYQMQEPGRA